jgi:hypothetical protein
MPERDAVVFLGPSLPRRRAAQILDADFRPPAARGDVYRACLGGPRVILLIDGVFENAPSVFHKELLWALSRGIHVYGAASMGALRAAELDRFGMVGVGPIYRAYRDGRIERDDAVAVLHGPAELAYSPITVALVDVLATLAKAGRAGVIDVPVRKVLEWAASGIPYKELDYGRLVETARASGCAPASLAAFEQWTQEHRVPRKALDAAAGLRRVAADLKKGLAPFAADFVLEPTLMWLHLKDEIDREEGRDPVLASLALPHESDSDGHVELRALAAVLAGHQGIAVTEDALSAAAHRFRYENGLLSADDVRRWLDENGLTDADYRAIVWDECLLEAVRLRFGVALASKLAEFQRRPRRPSNAAPGP